MQAFLAKAMATASVMEISITGPSKRTSLRYDLLKFYVRT